MANQTGTAQQANRANGRYEGFGKLMENCLAGGDDFRGDDGPLVLERGPATSPLFRAFFEAVKQAGYQLTDDVNGFRQEGFAAFDRNIDRGHRGQCRSPQGAWHRCCQ